MMTEKDAVFFYLQIFLGCDGSSPLFIGEEREKEEAEGSVCGDGSLCQCLFVLSWQPNWLSDHEVSMGQQEFPDNQQQREDTKIHVKVLQSPTDCEGTTVQQILHICPNMHAAAQHEDSRTAEPVSMETDFVSGICP